MKFHLLGAVVAIALTSPAVAVTNLVVNPGFETGDFTGWTQTGNTGNSGVDAASAFTGSFGAFFGPVGSRGGIVQTLDTLAGRTYRVSYALENTSGAPTNRFGIFFDGVTQFAAFNLPAFPYQIVGFDVVATDDRSTFALLFQNDSGVFRVDDFVVSLVPEPASWALMIAGFGLVGYGLRNRRRSAVSA